MYILNAVVVWRESVEITLEVTCGAEQATITHIVGIHIVFCVQWLSVHVTRISVMLSTHPFCDAKWREYTTITYPYTVQELSITIMHAARSSAWSIQQYVCGTTCGSRLCWRRDIWEAITQLNYSNCHLIVGEENHRNYCGIHKCNRDRKGFEKYVK